MRSDAGGRPSKGGPDRNTATNGGSSIADGRGDPREVGELLGAWLDIRMAEVDDLVAEARSRVDTIPDLRTLWLLAGEILVRLAAVEHELATQHHRRERKRPR